jgi:hypothetical protein
VIARAPDATLPSATLAVLPLAAGEAADGNPVECVHELLHPADPDRAARHEPGTTSQVNDHDEVWNPAGSCGSGISGW